MRFAAFQRQIVDRENLRIATVFVMVIVVLLVVRVIMDMSAITSAIKQQHMRCFFMCTIMHRKPHGGCKKHSRNQKTG